MSRGRILVAEDDLTLAETLAYNLRTEGFEPTVTHTGLQALVATRRDRPDLILLDIMLPEMDGFEVCRIVRAESSIPIIMLTARDGETDAVVGLEMGADDYVTKPFRLRELMARINAALRRAGASLDDPETLTSGDLTMDVAPRSVALNGREIHLLPREFDLLHYLMQNPGVVLTRSRLLETVWGPEYLGDTRTVDVHVRRLRAKIEPDDDQPRYIRTVHGVGYVFGGRGNA
jgi:two-component system, OmpR family, response regulator RegX3